MALRSAANVVDSMCIVEKYAHDILDTYDVQWSVWFGHVNEVILRMMFIFDWYMFVGRVLWLG